LIVMSLQINGKNNKKYKNCLFGERAEAQC